MSTTLSFGEFGKQLHDEGCLLAYRGLAAFAPVDVVIRGTDGDYALVAVHQENGRLIFDLGPKLKED